MCGCLLCAPYWGPGLQPRQALTGNPNGDFLVRRPALSPLSHTSRSPNRFNSSLVVGIADCR